MSQEQNRLTVISESTPDSEFMDFSKSTLPGKGPDERAVELYLDLLKRCLTDLIFIDHPLANVVPFDLDRPRGALKNVFLRLLVPFLDRYRIKLVEAHSTPWIKDVDD